MKPTLLTSRDDNGILTITFDAPDKPVNTITPAVLEELDALIDRIQTESPQPAAVIFTSAKEVFINGADLFEMRDLERGELEAFIARGQHVYQKIADLKITTVAAINGHCLGGGLELALACDIRVAADLGAINIGLPETKLGILPAWGGTTRLPRVIGLTQALPLLLAGKTMPPRKSQKIGLIDEVVRPERLLAAARRLAQKPPHRKTLGRIDRMIAACAPLRSFVLNRARKLTLRETHGHYPAPIATLDVVKTAMTEGLDAGLRAEREAITHLIETPACSNLMRLFFLRQDAKKHARAQAGGVSRPIRHAAVVGGGTMGAGIAAALIKAGIPTRLIEISADALAAGMKRIDKELQNEVRTKRMSQLEADTALRRIIPAMEIKHLKLADVVIEAVAERPEVKQSVFQALASACRPDAILATNTSSLSVTPIAESVEHPGRVIGLHFFNPVAKMPLLEIVRTPLSDGDALATGVELGLQLGKVPVVVNDAPGFLVNRLLIPQLAEAMNLAAEGVDITRIDRVMKDWGMPMGPFELLDTVGIDIAVHILASLGERIGDHLVAPPATASLIERGDLGRKTGRGFYHYDAKGRKTSIHHELIAALRAGVAARESSDEDILWRQLVPMINEAARVLDAGVVDNTDTIDLSTVMGLGLAPFRGGLMRFTESEGLDVILAEALRLAQTVAPRVSPVQRLRHATETHGTLDGRPIEAPRPGTPWRGTSSSSNR